MIHLENLIIKYKDNFGRELKLCELNGIKRIIAYWESKPEYTDLRWLAYILATISHEVDGTFKPIEEYGKGKGLAYGKPNESGKVFFGRGFVQLTWSENYARFGKILGINLTGNPDLALDFDVALKICFIGMTKGMFTGKKRSDYFNSEKTDPVGARKIINGTDKAALIANYYSRFYQLLTT